MNRRTVVALLALLAVSASGQTGDESASALIRSLSPKRPNGKPIVVVFRCGLITGPLQGRQTAIKLVELGKTALPDLERAFDLIEKKESQSGFDRDWLF